MSDAARRHDWKAQRQIAAEGRCFSTFWTVGQPESPSGGTEVVPDNGGRGIEDFVFEGAVVEWRGPAPFYFVAIPEEDSADIQFAAKGWSTGGQVPVMVRIKDAEFSTALCPKDGRYLLPLNAAVRKSARIAVGQVVAVELSVGRPRGGSLGTRPRGRRGGERTQLSRHGHFRYVRWPIG